MDRFDAYWGTGTAITPRELDADERAAIAKIEEAIALLQQADAIVTGVHGTLDGWSKDYADAEDAVNSVMLDLGGLIGQLRGAARDIEAVPAEEAQRAEDARACGEDVA